MPDTPIEPASYHLSRSSALDFHYRQGVLWLRASGDGEHSTPLAYAAFEFRLALERMAFELLLRIEGGESPSVLLEASRSFKRLEKKIYELGGHQRELDRKIAFMNVVLRLARAKFQLATVNVGTLSRLWHECSELCHVYYTLALAADTPEVGVAAATYDVLKETERYLQGASTSLIGWARSTEPWFVELEKAYVAGEVGDEQVEAKLKETGIWGVYRAPDGTKTFAEDLEPRSS